MDSAREEFLHCPWWLSFWLQQHNQELGRIKIV
jgi:hypothetical protein